MGLSTISKQLHTSANSIWDLRRKVFISPTHMLICCHRIAESELPSLNRPALDWTDSRPPTHFTSISPQALQVEHCQYLLFVSKHLPKHPLKNVCLLSCILVCRAVNRRTICCCRQYEVSLFLCVCPCLIHTLLWFIVFKCLEITIIWRFFLFIYFWFSFNFAISSLFKSLILEKRQDPMQRLCDGFLHGAAI